MPKKILFAGESWTTYSTHVKGFDSFYTSTYAEGIEYIRNAILGGGYELNYMPSHVAAENFPYTAAELKAYDCVVLSDIGSNTLLLPNATFVRSEIRPNRLEAIRDYVMDGGRFVMIGGYMSFTGVDAKARYGETVIKDILPVRCLPGDDRVELPQGLTPVVDGKHAACAGLGEAWPILLGYNKTEAVAGCEVTATIGGDPLIAFGRFGKGASAVFTSDCAPHWCPPEFVGWERYDKLWTNLFGCLMK